MENIPKTCTLCNHFRFEGGERGYSKLTPGSDWSSRCEKHDEYDVANEKNGNTIN